MKTTNLSFAEIRNIEPQICEVIINDGVEIDAVMLEECHDFLRSNTQLTSALLINKKNDYTYSFAAQQNLLDLPHIKAMAFVVYKDSTRRVVELLSHVPKDYPWNMKIFTEYEEAIAWLQNELSSETA
jgi:hypothetical protein